MRESNTATGEDCACSRPLTPARRPSPTPTHPTFLASRCAASVKQQQRQLGHQQQQQQPSATELRMALALLAAAPAAMPAAALADEAAEAAGEATASAGFLGLTPLGLALVFSPIVFYVVFNIFRSQARRCGADGGACGGRCLGFTCPLAAARGSRVQVGSSNPCTPILLPLHELRSTLRPNLATPCSSLLPWCELWGRTGRPFAGCTLHCIHCLIKHALCPHTLVAWMHAWSQVIAANIFSILVFKVRLLPPLLLPWGCHPCCRGT